MNENRVESQSQNRVFVRQRVKVEETHACRIQLRIVTELNVMLEVPLTRSRLHHFHYKEVFLK